MNTNIRILDLHPREIKSRSFKLGAANVESHRRIQNESLPADSVDMRQITLKSRTSTNNSRHDIYVIKRNRDIITSKLNSRHNVGDLKPKDVLLNITLPRNIKGYRMEHHL